MMIRVTVPNEPILYDRKVTTRSKTSKILSISLSSENELNLFKTYLNRLGTGVPYEEIVNMGVNEEIGILYILDSIIEYADNLIDSAIGNESIGIKIGRREYHEHVSSFLINRIREIPPNYINKIVNYLHSMFERAIDGEGYKDIERYTYIRSSVPIAKTNNISIKDIVNDDNRNKLYFVTEDGTFSVKLEKVKTRKGINGIVSAIEENVMDTYAAQIKTIENIYVDKIKELNKTIDDIGRDALKQAFVMLGSLSGSGWEYKDGFVYNNKPYTYIYASQIRYKNMIYHLKEKYQNIFYIKGIYLKIGYNGDVGNGYAEYAFHPNAQSYRVDTQFGSEKGETCSIQLYNLCLGDLSGLNVMNVTKNILNEFSTVNLESAYSNPATSIARSMMRSYLINPEKYDYFDSESQIFLTGSTMNNR